MSDVYQKNNSHIDALMSEQASRIKALEAENICAVCAGSGKPASGLLCICGGTGKACDEAQHARELAYDRGKRIEELEEALRIIIRQVPSTESISDYYDGQQEALCVCRRIARAALEKR